MQGYAMPEEVYSLATPAGLDPRRVKGVFSQNPGPLPISTSVTVERANQFWIFQGSFFSGSTGVRGIVFRIDGVDIYGSAIFVNAINTHLVAPFTAVKTAVGVGAHTVSIAAGSGTPSTDSNDGFSLWLIELENTQELVRIDSRPPVVTSLPTSPEHGQEVYYKVDAYRLWHFRYDSAVPDGYKWHFLGGAPLTSVSDQTVRNTASGSYVTLTGSPAVTVPLAGYYLVEHGAGLWSSTAANNVNMATIKFGAAAASDAYAIRSSPGGAADADSQMSIMRKFEGPAVAAGSVLEQMYRVTGGTLSTIDRWMSVSPLRVG